MPEEYSQWTLKGQNGVESLSLGKARVAQLGDNEILVKIGAASLNYRDIAIAKGAAGLSLPKAVVPASDGAGTVVKVGNSVTHFKSGDNVCMHMVPFVSDSTFPDFSHISGGPSTTAGLGHGYDGALRQYGVFHETALVPMPKNLNFEQAATLTCSGLTAWNALSGGKGIKKGDVVLTQGTGGVSIAALQFAKAAGATVIATTSSDAKAERLKALGADHIINYKLDKNWGEKAKSLTPDNRGVDNIVDVGGLSTLVQSMKAVRVEGVVTVTGILGQAGEEPLPGLLDVLWRPCAVRGVLLGSREQFREMNRFVEEKSVEPVVDEKVFGFEDVREAYKYLEQQRHFSKVVIKVA